MQRPAIHWHRAILLTILFVLAAAPTLQAQKLKQRMAERYAAVFDYPRMAAVYEDIIASGKGVPEDYRQLAVSYKRMDQGQKAVDTYKKLIDLGSATPDDLLTYADLLRGQGRYAEATSMYALYAEQVPDDPRAEGYLKGGDLFANLKRDSTVNSVRTLAINSTEADLGPTVMDSLLIFSSARGEGVGGTAKYKWDREPFLNLYTAILDGGNASDPMVMRKEVNSRYHDGAASYAPLMRRLYFTRDNYYYGKTQRDSTGELKLGIYYADIKVNENGVPVWSTLVPFIHNDPSYNVGQPFLTPDGKRMYFVSDMPGGQGGTDIWYCDDVAGQWAAPKNLGSKVNTSGKEMYPFVTADSVLYFSSTGHPGLGGFDIFSVQLLPERVGRIFNLGYPINTLNNDQGLILLSDDSTGFFFSDRPGGMGSDDIYGCTVHPPLIHVEGVVMDKLAQTPIIGYGITVKNALGKPVDDAKVEYLDGGRFSIVLPYSERYVVQANRDGYRQAKADLDAENDDLSSVVLQLEKYDYGAEGIVMLGDDLTPIEGATVQLCDPNGATIDVVTTGADGKYDFALQAATGYRLKVGKEDFFNQSASISTKGKPNTVIHTDFKLFKLQVNAVVRLDNIYYDVSKWDIRKDAAVELDKLVQTLRDNPDVRIELSSHTDCRGKDSYNLTLSEKRAKSAVAYVIQQGIDKDRLEAKGYGETKPVSTCVCDQCTDKDYQMDRRTEFKVLSK